MIRNALTILAGLVVSAVLSAVLSGLIILVHWLIGLVVGKTVAAYVVTGLVFVVSFFTGRQAYLAVRGYTTARTIREFFTLRAP